MQEKTERFEMRLDQKTLDRIDEWREKQNNFPSRAEVVRRFVEDSLSRNPVISDGEKLILLMLCDLYKSMNIKSDFDTNFIESVIYGGHYWGLKWKFTGVFHDYVDKESHVSEVCDILDMWFFIEIAYCKLTDEDKNYIKQQVPIIGKDVKFPGFDGNNEAEHLTITRFMIEELNRFAHFKDRVHDMNSHSPELKSYRQMLAVFTPMRKKLIGIDLSAKQIVTILKAELN